jgi:hypothetical protein
MATHIQIGDVSPRIQYTADGVQTAFTYPFPIFADADVEVYEGATLKTLTTDYAITGAGNSAGGTVTFAAPPTAAAVVTLKRALAIKRTTDFQESGEFRAKVINDELDYQTAALQQVNDDLGRSLRLADTDAAAALTLPDTAARAGKYLGFDAQGAPIATDAAGPMGPVGPAGNMDGANNLSELTVPATARTNLGLVIGTDVLAPTGDGSGLTGVKTGATAAEKADIMLNAFRIQVNGGLSVQNMVDGISDEFVNQTGVDLAASINETHDAAGKLYSPSLTYSLDVTAEAFAIKSSEDTSNGQLAVQAFDNLTADVTADRWRNLVANDGAQAGTEYIGQDFGAANAQHIRRVVLTQGRAITTAEMIAAIDIQYSDDGAGWTTALAATGLNTAVYGAETIDLPPTAAHRYWRLLAAVNNANGWIVTEIEMMTATTPNMTLQSVAITALAQPDNVFAILRQEDVDAVTPNADLIFEAGRDGGTTWTAVPLAEVMTDGAARIFTGSADISAQPVGTSMKWRVRTLNNKEQKIHAVGLEWS